MQHSVLFLCGFFLHALSVQFLSIGAIVGIATGFSDPVEKTAIVVALQAVASIGAVFLSRNSRIANMSVLARVPLFLLLPILSALLSQLTPMSGVWLSALSLRWILGFLLLALINSDIRRLFADDLLERNRQAQILNTVASAVAFGLAPLLAAKIGVSILFFVDSFWQIAACLIFVLLSKSSFYGEVELSAEYPLKEGVVPLQSVWRLPSLISSVLVWSILGTFMIIEVPLLRERFDASAEMISGFFLISIFANLIATKLLKVRLLEKSGLQILVIGGVGMILGSVAYLQSYILVIAFATVVIIGLANGVFNLAQSSLLQQIEDNGERTLAFVLLRLYTNVGLLFGAGVVYLAELIQVSYVTPISVVAFGVTLLLLTLLRNEGGETYVAQRA